MGLGVVNFLAIISLYVVNFYVSEHKQAQRAKKRSPPLDMIDTMGF